MIRILVVDDDANFRRAMRRMLRFDGVMIEEAADGREAIQLYSTSRADIILCDLLMPGTNGLQVIWELTATFPQVRVVAVSGGGTKRGIDLLTAAQRLGAVAALEKPFTQTAMLMVLNRILPDFPIKPQMCQLQRSTE